MAASKLASFVLLAILSVAVSSARSPRRSFTLPLIHRDAPNSPFHNPNHSHYDQVRSTISRSITRGKWISTQNVGSDIIPNQGDYLMRVSIGTPPFPILATADTTSDLTWTQCEPCVDCYSQQNPIFDSRKSSTYRPVSCSAQECTSSGSKTSCDSSQKCHYSVVYGDAATSSGTIAAETFTLGSSTFPNTVFGCGFENGHLFNPAGSGKIGLGNGPTSLIGQLDKSIGGKFSYCLPDGTKSSQINFGENAVVTGPGVVSTPLATGPNPSLYYLTLNAITVGGKRVPFTSSSAGGKGNIVIDSATYLLHLPRDFLTSVKDEIRKQVTAEEVDDPNGQLSLCYYTNGFTSPKMVSNFDGGDVQLNEASLWTHVWDNIVCLAATEGSGVFGNGVQKNFLIGFDRQRKTVSFKPTDCSK